MIIPPRVAIIFSSLITLAVVLLMITFATAMPRLGIQWKEGPEKTLMVAAVDTDALAKILPPGTIVTHFIARGETLPAHPNLIIEEPDTLTDYSEFNQFIKAQKPLTEALQKNQLQLKLADGRIIPTQTRPAHLGDLPFLFWFQILVGAAGALTGAMVWMLGEKNRATFLYALTGLGYLIFAPTAAVYSTRELAVDPTLFQCLSAANHFGALFFTASLTSLLWYYPKPLGKFPAATVIYLITLLSWLMDFFQAFDSSIILHISTLSVFAISLVFSILQWRHTKNKPADRAALRWFLLSIYIATGLFAGAVIIPAALNWPLPASQGVMFGVFLIMYWGIALGVIRYRLFQLEEWWQSIWSWFISGLSIILLDIFLVSFLHFEAPAALAFSAAIVGWLYFPLRQWLWKKLEKDPRQDIQRWLPQILPLLIHAPDGENPEQQFLARWPEILRIVFDPLSIENSDGSAGILEDGLAIRIDSISPHTNSLIIRSAQKGQRLFSFQDLETIQALKDFFHTAYETHRDHENTIRQENQRIARDLHDDINAQLLRLLAKSNEENRGQVRSIINATRELTNTVNQISVPLTTATSRWRVDLRQRCEDQGTSLNWSTQGNDDGMYELGARLYANLTRILHEAFSIALRENRAKHITLHLTCDDNHLHVQIRDDGKGRAIANAATESATGQSHHIIRTRTEELGGEVQWRFNNGCSVDITLPLTTQ